MELARSLARFALPLILAANSAHSLPVPIPIAADWAGPSQGTLGGVSFSFSAPGGVSLRDDLGAPAYSFAPLPSGTEALSYNSADDWTVVFDEPVSDLLVYLRFFRGSTTILDDPAARYAFDAPFSIASGLQFAGVEDDTLILDDLVGFHDGILRFAGPTTSLSVGVSGGTVVLPVGGPLETPFGQQVLTFGLPEPDSALLLLAGLLCWASRCSPSPGSTGRPNRARSQSGRSRTRKGSGVSSPRGDR